MTFLVVAEEFGGFSDANRRIDLLCIDREVRPVVVELKRTNEGGHMELQAPPPVRIPPLAVVVLIERCRIVATQLCRSVPNCEAGNTSVPPGSREPRLALSELPL